MSQPAGPGGSAAPRGQLPRLIAPGPPLDLAAHTARHGPVPSGGPALLASIERAGLAGRGGAGFPTARKMRAVAQAAGRPALAKRRGGLAVVANGVESEPASGKDALLLRQSPHLVLDGIALAAGTIGATAGYLCVDSADPERAAQLTAAVAERQRRGFPDVPVQVVAVPHGYISSEESALMNFLNGGPAIPLYVPPRPFERGVGGRATLVLNVETLAHVALIARHGPDWFTAVGDRGAPGSALLTISGAVRRAGVYEIALGTLVGDLLELAGGVPERAQAVLAGGYYGSWLPLPAAAGVPASPAGLHAAGAALGAGVLIALPASACGLAETARVLRYLAGESAGQCGPCTFGLPAMADALAQIAWRGRDTRAADWLRSLLPLVARRGACHFPDGAVALAGSALRVFAADLDQHLAHGPCPAARRPTVLAVPRNARAAAAGAGAPGRPGAGRDRPGAGPGRRGAGWTTAGRPG